MTEYDEIETLHELVLEVQNQKTGGYEVDFDIQPNRERRGREFWLIIDVHSSEPDPEVSVNGQWWFDADGRVMQVL